MRGAKVEQGSTRVETARPFAQEEGRRKEDGKHAESQETGGGSSTSAEGARKKEREKEWLLVPGVRAARAAHGSTGACAAHACVTPIGETSAREARGEVVLNEEGNCFLGVEKRTKDGERRPLKLDFTSSSTNTEKVSAHTDEMCKRKRTSDD
ncbi:uncharacterized protein LOC122532213 [Frieseomelitta varia]|uniref:uncharacterized protein LOC122532213 n=1 Tax=Frieseomelitta varia TaxID=561572 RepID=UPI001CB68709|nr:uncharacterized protein LOC122532213 [Frieseomelitta varia]